MAVWVFDLDDTLFSEYDFLCSGFRVISNHFKEFKNDKVYQEMIQCYKRNEDVLGLLDTKYPCVITKEQFLSLYRFHHPDIELKRGVLSSFAKIKEIGGKIAIITDGRSKTQRNKIKALGINSFIDKLIISEELGTSKPDKDNFLSVQSSFTSEDHFTYVGDNIRKDFVTPNRLGWNTIGIRDDGNNIHSQNVDVSDEYKPQIWVDSFEEIEIIITNEN
ncbi:HAD family hydrolase [Halosquirtibacter laminarini]|uniref:HAD family hydrolase n=1 Tax=Halosquirtibacter laminarini TaxID=3374600 RepID=A0AC61NBL7_9BACT|nr:HAD family hydrolase [Prolixibacteraceae bacterium]